MGQTATRLKANLDKCIGNLWERAGWRTPRKETDALRYEAIALCHAYHREANPAYRDRCEREEYGSEYSKKMLHGLVFPEEIYKGYAYRLRQNGKILGVFCEVDTHLLVEYLNYYLINPIKLNGVRKNYRKGTNLKGGLDQFRHDILQSQNIYIATSSGSTGSSLSLIPVDPETFATYIRVQMSLFHEVTNCEGHGPLDPEKGFLLSFTPRKASMMMSIGIDALAKRFGDRAVMSIPAKVETRELRWQQGVFNGVTGKLLKLMFTPFMTRGGETMIKKSFSNALNGLHTAEKQKLRTGIFTNPWMSLNSLRKLESLLENEIREGRKKPGEPLISLHPGSLLMYGGGNKTGLNIPEQTITARFKKIISGIDKVVDVYAQAESLGMAMRCIEGNYHLDPHVEYFIADSYLARFDPREMNRVPVIITGDQVDEIHNTPCACGITTRYFKKIKRDDINRGSKGCAAVLADYM